MPGFFNLKKAEEEKPPEGTQVIREEPGGKKTFVAGQEEFEAAERAQEQVQVQQEPVPAQAGDAWPRQEPEPVQARGDPVHPSQTEQKPEEKEEGSSPEPQGGASEEELTERETALYYRGFQDGARATKRKIMEVIL